MYEIAKNVIMRADYELSDILTQLKALRLSGDISEDQLMELMEMARANACPDKSVDYEQRWRDHENRIRALEQKLEQGSAPEPSPEYPDWVDGKSYLKGDKVSFKGKRYVCILNEYTDSTTWSPEAYLAYWLEVRE